MTFRTHTHIHILTHTHQTLCTQQETSKEPTFRTHTHTHTHTHTFQNIDLTTQTCAAACHENIYPTTPTYAAVSALLPRCMALSRLLISHRQCGALLRKRRALLWRSRALLRICTSHRQRVRLLQLWAFAQRTYTDVLRKCTAFL